MNKLDQLAQHLEQKHRHRLEAMTRATLQTPPPAVRRSWLHPALMRPLRLRSTTTTMVMAFAASAALAAVLLAFLPEKSPTLPVTLATLPDWVKDTDVPLTLLENMAFYDWLSQQPSNQSAASQNRLVLADNQPDRLGPGWRYATTDPAERFSGGFARDGSF
ncbi:MAG: hypothetical protein KJ914_17770 [Gammaproteobacteria bacterium]|nr:hypothetical protein [Gammaproteobacteria bacterium]MBU1724277.1 hypothetical protein [Gammaproteobacteria bacterium]MBU2006295.1 hypothetical protein [Gammaproteobacteria bacterium]